MEMTLKINAVVYIYMYIYIYIYRIQKQLIAKCMCQRQNTVLIKDYKLLFQNFYAEYLMKQESNETKN
jgi:hypothetical protein